MKKSAIHLIYFAVICLVMTAGLPSCGDSAGKGDETPAAMAPGSQDTVYSDARGNVLTMADVNSFPIQPPPPQSLQMNIPPEAQQMLMQARQLGQAGQTDQFLETVRRASDAAPEWPQPWYDLAYHYLLADEYGSALEYFERVNELAPEGFYYTKAGIHTLKREAAGTLPDGFFKDFVAIEQLQDKEEAMTRLESIAEMSPNFCPAWLSIAQLQTDPNQSLAAIDRGLTANCDSETFGLLVLNKAAILRQFNEIEESTRLLGELIFNKNSTDFVRNLARASMRQNY